MFNSSHPGVQLDKGHRERARMAQRQASQRWLGSWDVFYLFVSRNYGVSIRCQALPVGKEGA